VISTINKTYQAFKKQTLYQTCPSFAIHSKSTSFDFPFATHHYSSEWFFITFRKKSFKLIARFFLLEIQVLLVYPDKRVELQYFLAL
jgi:hypothetical protein